MPAWADWANATTTPSRRGFFRSRKRECVRCRTYLTREAAKQEVFGYIEMFSNPKSKHTKNGTLSPVDLKAMQPNLNAAGI